MSEQEEEKARLKAAHAACIGLSEERYAGAELKTLGRSSCVAWAHYTHGCGVSGSGTHTHID